MRARIRTVTESADHGASAVEYSLLLAGIAAVIVAFVFLFGDILVDTCATTADAGTTGRARGCTTTTP